jgi:hypothetical protein
MSGEAKDQAILFILWSLLLAFKNALPCQNKTKDRHGAQRSRANHRLQVHFTNLTGSNAHALVMMLRF